MPSSIAATSIHCPLCNSRAVAGNGLVIFADGGPLVEYRCGECGELFLVHDRRDTDVISPRDLI